MVGMHIGAYSLTEELGEGGMGTVFKGVHTGLEKLVAVKMLDAEQAGDTTLRQRFLNEAQILSRLNSPHIVTVYDFIEHEGRFFIVMEYVDGGTLQNRLARQGALPPDEAVDIIRQVLEGIRHAHEAQPSVIHRDIKPANILISEAGRVKVSDFGTARLVGHERLTAGGMAIGTTYYMAPECQKGQEADAPTIDVYSVGVTLYEMCCGRKPYTGGDEIALVRAVLAGKAVPPREHAGYLPERLERAILKAMDRSAKRRFRTAAEFLAEMESVRKEMAEKPVKRPITGQAAVLPRGRGWFGRVVMWTLALLGFVWLAYAGWRFGPWLEPLVRRVPHLRWAVSGGIMAVGFLATLVLALRGRSVCTGGGEVCANCGLLVARNWDRCQFCRDQGQAVAGGVFLAVAQGKNVGTRFPVAAGALTIGRSAENDIHLADAGVSKIHARVSLVEGKLVLQDLDSKNGCFVNGRRMTRAVLRHKDSIQLGSTLLLVSRE